MHLLLGPNLAHGVLVVDKEQVCNRIAHGNIAMRCKLVGLRTTPLGTSRAEDIVNLVVGLVVEAHIIHRHLVDNSLGDIHRNQFASLAELVILRSVYHKVVYQFALDRFETAAHGEISEVNALLTRSGLLLTTTPIAATFTVDKLLRLSVAK